MTRSLSRTRLAGLDWLNFFVATLQTGFGPFIAVYLTTNKWTQAQIGIALSVGTAVAVLSQVPAGALVDMIRAKRVAVLVSMLLVSASAVILALWPMQLPVMAAQALHGFASCMLAPSIAALTLALVGPSGFAERIGRNARWSAFGNAGGALLMGVFGTLVSSRAVFWLAAAIAAPALVALQVSGRGRPTGPATAAPSPGGARRLLADRRLQAFGACVVLFHLCNAALLPLAGGALTKRAGDNANLLIALCIIVPQLVVALLSPGVAEAAQRCGRRPVMLLGFAALPVRAVLFAGFDDPSVVVAAQALDGVSAAAFGVLLPLIASDVTHGTGRFNLCLGMMGLAAAVGATLSTALAGAIATEFSDRIAFLALAAAGIAAVFAVQLLMPETKRHRAAFQAARLRAG